MLRRLTSIASATLLIAATLTVMAPATAAEGTCQELPNDNANICVFALESCPDFADTHWFDAQGQVFVGVCAESATTLPYACTLDVLRDPESRQYLLCTTYDDGSNTQYVCHWFSAAGDNGEPQPQGPPACEVGGGCCLSVNQLIATGVGLVLFGVGLVLFVVGFALETIIDTLNLVLAIAECVMTSPVLFCV